MAKQLTLNTELQDTSSLLPSNNSVCTVLDTPIPETSLQLKYQEEHLIRIKFIRTEKLIDNYQKTTPRHIAQQFNCFFNGEKHRFDLPFDLIGTPFQKKVWQALAAIPAGTQQTYGHLAKQLNSSPRAVGNACRNNPLPILFPCHRIVRQDSMGGFMGQTQGHALDIKQWLLQHEEKHFR